jgi:hypothetical protein
MEREGRPQCALHDHRDQRAASTPSGDVNLAAPRAVDILVDGCQYGLEKTLT